MPPTPSLLTLGSGPGCVHEARRWVALRCQDLGRTELTECAEAGVSELVTNALLHAEAPIEVRVTGTSERPRIEVRDASTQVPELPDLDAHPVCDEEDLSLLTFGRGLAIVARSSRAWGAEVQVDGKVVWFEPSEVMSEERPPAGQITGAEPLGPGAAAPGRGQLELVALAAPVRLVADAMRHHRELRREIRLLALTTVPGEGLAHDLSAIFTLLDRPLRAAKAVSRPAGTSGEDERTVDLRLRLPPDLPEVLRRLESMLEEVDASSRDGRLLTAARTPEQRAFQRWFLLELADQADGAEPTPWDARIRS